MPEPTTINTTKLERQLEVATRIIGQFIPLVGVGFNTYAMVRAMFIKSGGDIGPFSAEDAEVTAARGRHRAALDEYYAEFGRPGEGGPVTPPADGGVVPPTPEGPPPGSTTIIGE